LVIDSNMFQDEILRDYLGQRKSNIAVITDYAKREAQQSVSTEHLRERMQILSEFSSQVLMLKGTKVVAKLVGRSKGLQRRLISKPETDFFPEFCKYLYGETEVCKAYQRQILEDSKKEREFLDSLKENMSDMVDVYKGLQSDYSDGDLRNLRTRKPMNDNNKKKLFSLMSLLTSNFASKIPGGIKWPKEAQWPNYFIYRQSLFYALHFQEWLIKGSPKELSAKKTRNDIIDLNYATYSTYFDGLLTKDKRCHDFYLDGDYILKNILIPSLSEAK